MTQPRDWTCRLLAVVLLLFVLLAARFFQAGNLLSATPFSLRRLATGWRK